METNREKVRRFYDDIICQYPEQDRCLFFGKETDFWESIQRLRDDFKGREEDQCEGEFSNSLRIIFSKDIFAALFTGSDASTIDRPKGQRYSDNDYLYLELMESPIARIETREESRLIPLSSEGPEECFFVNEERPEDTYYPREVLPFFVSQLKERITKDFKFFSYASTDTPVNFCSLFEPMRYILKVKKQNERLLAKLLYKLSVHLGIVEFAKKEIRKVAISQQIESLLDDGNFFLSDKESYGLSSLAYYLSAISNPHIVYQFLDLYNVLEFFYYRYFYEYVTTLETGDSPRKLYDSVKSHTGEWEMLRLVVEDVSTRFLDIYSRLTGIEHTSFRQFCKNVLERDNIDLAKWSCSETHKFANCLADFIYSIRNQAVHSKPGFGKNIRDLSEDEQEVLSTINRALCLIVREILEKNITW